jgi:hypothetical protein
MKDSRIIAMARTGFRNPGTTIFVLQHRARDFDYYVFSLFFHHSGELFHSFSFEITIIILSFYFLASRPEGQLDKIYIKRSYPRASGERPLLTNEALFV